MKRNLRFPPKKAVGLENAYKRVVDPILELSVTPYVAAVVTNVNPLTKELD